MSRFAFEWNGSKRLHWLFCYKLIINNYIIIILIDAVIESEIVYVILHTQITKVSSLRVHFCKVLQIISEYNFSGNFAVHFFYWFSQVFSSFERRHKHVFVCHRWRVSQICFSLMRIQGLDCSVTCLAMKIVSISGAINSRCSCKCDCNDGILPWGIWFTSFCWIINSICRPLDRT